MPKLYEYFGLVVFFYANEHEPIHVHGEFQGGHARAEILLKDGKVVRIVFSAIRGKPPLPAGKLKDFQGRESILEKQSSQGLFPNLSAPMPMD